MIRLLTGASCVALVAGASPAAAQYFYIGDVFEVGFNFCPRYSAPTNGQLLSISQNSALFSLLGTTYGGNGTTTFGLPDLRSRSAIGQGTGPGLSTFTQGAMGGTETVTLTLANMPSHTHDAHVMASSAAPDTNLPGQNTFPTFPVGTNIYTTGRDNTPMGDDEVQVGAAGSGQPFSNRDPYTTTQYCIATQGYYPPRN